MAVQFDMVGKLSLPKETDKFKPFETKEYGSGWTNKVLKFNCTSGDNRFMLQSKGGFFKDGSSKIYVFSKDATGSNGERIKGEQFTIAWKERLTHPRLAEVAEFKKFIVDLELPNFRRELQNALDKVKDGKELTEEEVEKFGASDKKGLEAALEKSNKKRKEFIAEADFVDFMYKVLTNENYKDKKFKIRGNYEMQYSDANNRFYSNYVPNRIYLAEDDAEETATANMVLFFGEDSLVDAKAEKNKYFVNGYVQQYDSNRKENIFAPYTIVIDASENEKKVKKLVDMLTTDGDAVKELGIMVQLLDGAQRSSIQLEDLDEETQDNILLGLTTLEDVRRELGGSMYGERITENRFFKLGRGYARGAEETSYTLEDLVIKALADKNKNAFEDANDEEDDDLFDDSDLFD